MSRSDVTKNAPRDLPERLSDATAAHMARLIESGVYAPGQQLPPERDLAEQLGVSRTAVREAFRALQALGLVEAHVGRGRFVTLDAAEKRSHYLAGQLFQLHMNELADLSEVRELLEATAIRRIDIDRCAVIAERLSDVLASAQSSLEQEDYAALARLDSEFHSIPLEYCRNRALQVLANGMIVAMGGATRDVLAAQDRATASLVEHHRIVSAFAAGDLELAAMLTGNHQNSAQHRRVMARAAQAVSD